MNEAPPRPTMVTVLAIVFIVGSSLMLLMSVVGVGFQALQLKMFDPTLKDQPILYPGLVFMTKYGWLMSIPDILLEGVMLAAAIRLLAMRRWAWKTLRIGTVVYLLMYSGRAAWLFWAMTQAQRNPAYTQPMPFSTDVMKWIIVGGTAFGLVIAFVIALILYWLLSQPTVVNAIRNAEEAAMPREFMPPPPFDSTATS